MLQIFGTVKFYVCFICYDMFHILFSWDSLWTHGMYVCMTSPLLMRFLSLTSLLQLMSKSANSMEHGPFLECNTHTANQELPRILWNPKVHIHNRSIILSSHHICVFQVVSFPQVSPPEPFMYHSSPTYVLCNVIYYPVHLILLDLSPE
jgi:hypothetical protein